MRWVTWMVGTALLVGACSSSVAPSSPACATNCRLGNECSAGHAYDCAAYCDAARSLTGGCETLLEAEFSCMNEPWDATSCRAGADCRAASDARAACVMASTSATTCVAVCQRPACVPGFNDCFGTCFTLEYFGRVGGCTAEADAAVRCIRAAAPDACLTQLSARCASETSAFGACRMAYCATHPTDHDCP